MTARVLAALLSLASASVAGQHYQEGLRHYAAEDYRQAQRSFEEAVREDPADSDYNLWLGLAIGRRLQTMSAFRRLGSLSLVGRAKRQFEKAVQLDDTNIDALDALMGFHLEAPGIMGGSKSEARAIAEHTQTVNPAHGAYAMGTWHEAVGELEAAGAQFELARELAPDNSGYLVAHAGYLARRGRHSDSDSLFEVAFARDPDNPAVWLAAAKTWIRAKRESLYQRARQLAERYLASADRPEDSDPPSEVRALIKSIPR